MQDLPVLSLTILLPLTRALGVMLCTGRTAARTKLLKTVALGVSVITGQTIFQRMAPASALDNRDAIIPSDAAWISDDRLFPHKPTKAEIQSTVMSEERSNDNTPEPEPVSRLSGRSGQPGGVVSRRSVVVAKRQLHRQSRQSHEAERGALGDDAIGHEPRGRFGRTQCLKEEQGYHDHAQDHENFEDIHGDYLHYQQNMITCYCGSKCRRSHAIDACLVLPVYVIGAFTGMSPTLNR